jgi:hypothetical protein
MNFPFDIKEHTILIEKYDLLEKIWGKFQFFMNEIKDMKDIKYEDIKKIVEKISVDLEKINDELEEKQEDIESVIVDEELLLCEKRK